MTDETAFRDDLKKLIAVMRRDLASGDFRVVFARYHAGAQAGEAERAYARVVNQAAGRTTSVTWLLARLEAI
jgi:predicted dienelactone hydrolase